ncbi:MAG TPA: SDR family oxidoreductase [Candidatus Limnocylindrales bacterium]|nr:SDR family oxidoreductase [Candidatus Limnocylindrales bacterium]
MTGATSGIGRATALALSDAGWWVLAVGTSAERGADVEAELRSRTGGQFAQADITDAGVPEQLVERSIRETGRLDLLVNSAGIHFLAPLDELDLTRFDRLMAVNLRAAVALARAALRVMLDQGRGTIINVASEAGIVAVRGQPAYNISKAGLIMLSRSIAADYAARGIRAVSVCPGTTRTPLVDEAIASAPDPASHERMLAELRPARRLGRVEEIAAAIVFAASDAVAYLNGTELVVDGGYTVV